MAATKSGRRGPRKRSAEEPQGDGVLWPGFKEQLQLRAHVPEAEQAAAAERAQLLVTQGWGALEEWLNHPGQHSGEGAQPSRPTARNRLADVFDDVAA